MKLPAQQLLKLARSRPLHPRREGEAVLSLTLFRNVSPRGPQKADNFVLFYLVLKKYLNIFFLQCCLLLLKSRADHPTPTLCSCMGLLPVMLIVHFKGLETTWFQRVSTVRHLLFWFSRLSFWAKGGEKRSILIRANSAASALCRAERPGLWVH